MAFIRHNTPSGPVMHTFYKVTNVLSGDVQYTAWEPEHDEEFNVQEVPLCYVPRWAQLGVLEELDTLNRMEQQEERNEFSAEYVGCDATSNVQVNQHMNEDTGEIEMHIATPIGDVIITKAQAKRFFGL